MKSVLDSADSGLDSEASSPISSVRNGMWVRAFSG